MDDHHYKKKKEINRRPLIGSEDDDNLLDNSILMTPERKKKKKYRERPPRSVHFKENADIRRIPSRYEEYNQDEEVRKEKSRLPQTPPQSLVDDDNDDDNDNVELDPKKPGGNEGGGVIVSKPEEINHMGRAMKNIIKHKVPLIIIGSVIVIGIVVICIYFFLNRKKGLGGSSFLDPKTMIKERFVKDEQEGQEISKRRTELNALKKPLEIAKDKVSKDLGYLSEQLKKQPKRVDIPSPGEDDEQGLGETFGDLNVAFQNPQAQNAKKNQIKGLMQEANKKYLEIETRLKSIQTELDYIAKF